MSGNRAMWLALCESESIAAYLKVTACHHLTLEPEKPEYDRLQAEIRDHLKTAEKALEMIGFHHIDDGTGRIKPLQYIADVAYLRAKARREKKAES